MKFVVNTVALGQVFLPVFRFPLSAVLHSHIHLNIARIRGKHGWSVAAFDRRCCCFGNCVALDSSISVPALNCVALDSSVSVPALNCVALGSNISVLTYSMVQSPS